VNSEQLLKTFGAVLSVISKGRSAPFSDQVDAKMVEKFLLLNLSHLSCAMSRDGFGLCDEVVTEFGEYLEKRGISVVNSIGIFQLLSLLLHSGIKSLERVEEEMEKEKEKEEEETKSEYNPKFPI
jgi:hypothetical protein